MSLAENDTPRDAATDAPINPTAFHLIGRAARSGLLQADGMDLRPALFAGFADLSKLRYDYPVVLGTYDGGFVRSLTDIFNGLLDELAPPGVDGEFTRSQLLGLEGEIRALIAESGAQPLSKAWKRAARKVRARAGNGSLEALDECLERAFEALGHDGRLIDCDAEAPMAFIRQAWAIQQKAKGYASRKRVDELILKLENILGAEVWKSQETLSPEHLKGSVGTSFEKAFDFDAMAEVLTPNHPRSRLPDDRRQRITSALRTLQSQRFFLSEKWSEKKRRRDGPHAFLFRSAASALKAIGERMGEMVELAKAISMAELEIANRYEPDKHDAFFAAYGETSLLPDDLAFFPTYLVVLGGKPLDAREKTQVLELLTSGMPVKVLAQTDDILDSLIRGAGRLPFGGIGWQLASMAVGLNNVFVLQSTNAHLYRLSAKIADGLAYDGPALFSVFSGAAAQPGLPPYLVAAAATESRAFPTFFYDPAAGPDWASRLSIDGNPQPERDWPAHSLSYEDAELQRASEEMDFTFIDFVAADPRFAKYFARVPSGEWTDNMVAAGRYLEESACGACEAVPCVLAVDGDDRLHKLVVDDRLVRAARGCRDMWHSLQEMGGVHNSHALRLLERERALWQAEKERELAEQGAQPQPMTAPEAAAEAEEPAAAPEAPPAPAEMPPEPASLDDPSIDTLRCTTCNECTDINPQMFAYNDNMQAYIADATAGTYRELVEAAENCQVSIIHPGKPKDPNEPNLEELMERAEEFL